MVGRPFAVGTNGGTTATVTLYNADRSVRYTRTPFGSMYTGEVRVAVGDVTGDGVADAVAVTAGSGGTPARVAIINGANGNVSTPALVPPTYMGQLSVTVGDVDADGTADIALGSNEGGSRARVYRGGTLSMLSDVLVPAGANFVGRTAVALGDMTADGKADLVITARYVKGTRVDGFKGASLVPGRTPVAAFQTFVIPDAFGMGVNLAIGDVNGDGYGDLIVGTFDGSVPMLKVFGGKALFTKNTLNQVALFSPSNMTSGIGMRVAVRDINGDGKLDIVTSFGEQVVAYDGMNLPMSGLPPVLFSFDPDLNVTGGVWVG